jgi:ribosome-associated toxin RatA of RatAB toxin-antitoxin module
MASVSKTEIFDVNINTLYKVITDYKQYPQFVSGVDAVEVHDQSDTSATVSYKLNLIKTFSYTLKHTHTAPTKVSWSLDSGDFFKKNEGYWELKDLGDNKTEVTYALDIDLKVFAPKMILNKLISHNFPATLKAFKDRATGLK